MPDARTQKDLTRQEAEALIKQRWGTLNGAFLGKARDGSWSICRNFMNRRSPMYTGATLREACERAGLLPAEGR